MLTLNQFYKPLPDIGLFAKTRSGKDEVYKILDLMGFDVERVAFGDVMKDKFFELFPNIPKEPKPIRELQIFNEMRQIDPEVWVRPTMNRVKLRADILAQATLVAPTFVYTDIRQPNEYQAVKDSGAFMVKVVSPLEHRVQRMFKLGETVTSEMLDAPLETMLDSFEYDHIIYNDGSKEDLHKQVTEMLFQIQQKRAERI